MKSRTGGAVIATALIALTAAADAGSDPFRFAPSARGSA
jgi:hypothetical protein